MLPVTLNMRGTIYFGRKKEEVAEIHIKLFVSCDKLKFLIFMVYENI